MIQGAIVLLIILQLIPHIWGESLLNSKSNFVYRELFSVDFPIIRFTTTALHQRGGVSVLLIFVSTERAWCSREFQHRTASQYEKVGSYFYGLIPMLCRLYLVNTEQITHCELAVIWPQKNTVEIQSTEVCRSTGPLKHGGTPGTYDLWRAVDLQKAVKIQS